MSVAFLFFEWAESLPRYLPVGCQTNCLKGVVAIGDDLYGADFHLPDWLLENESLFMVTIFAAIVGCLIYVHNFWLPFRLWRSFPALLLVLSRLTRFYELYLRCVSGHQPVGIMVDHIGWHGGFYLLGCGIFVASFSAGYHIVVQLNLNVQSRIYKRTLITFPRAVSLGREYIMIYKISGNQRLIWKFYRLMTINGDGIVMRKMDIFCLIR